MKRIACRLLCHSDGAHIQQVYTGLSMLHRAGVIELTQEIVPPPPPRQTAAQHVRDAWRTHATVVVRDGPVVRFDMHDACDIDSSDLAGCDFYVKRSYAKAIHDRLPGGTEKVLPYGLNYHVLPNHPDRFGLWRALRLPATARERMRGVLRAMDSADVAGLHCRERDFVRSASAAAQARVLFLVTAYDPYDVADRNPEKIEERHRSNETRALCIRLLRKELGPRFLGGFSHNAYTMATYGDCLATDVSLTRKEAYLSTMHAHAVCVATTGLHGSNGWKLAEYVAGARAIVSERLVYDVPGGFAPERHYLKFRDAHGCVQQCLRLIQDAALCDAMRAANAAYYCQWLRPDALVLNALGEALARAQQEAENRLALPLDAIATAPDAQ